MARKTALPLVLVAAAVLVAAFALNPSADRHRQQIRSQMGERSPLVRALGLGSLAAFTSRYHSLGLGSYTTAGDTLLSVGALGFVYVREAR
jgi:hypothetical protein